jgi:hypothetical protein
LIKGGTFQPSPLKEISPHDFEQRGWCKRGYTHASLQREKLWILGTKKIFGLPCSLLHGMAAPLNHEESNHLMPRDSVLLIQNLHWMLQIRHVSIEGRDIVDNDIHRWLQRLLQLRDVEHNMWYATFPSLARTRNGLM